MKRIVLLLCVVLYAFVCHAQIQKRIMGAEIGVSTEQDIVNIMSENNISFQKDDNILHVSNISLANHKWEDGCFILNEGKLVAIMFLDKKNGDGGEVNIIRESLKVKYEKYIIHDLGAMILYFDGETALMFLNEDKVACIAYVSKEYMENMVSRVMNEL